MVECELSMAVEVIPGRLYWVAVQAKPKDTANSHYFSIDNKFFYQPFAEDFGPFNLSTVFRFCELLKAKLTDPALAGKRILHCCSHDAKKRTNAACLMCLFQVAVMGRAAEAAYKPFEKIKPAFIGYRDATSGPCTFSVTIMDCAMGLEEGMRRGWFDMSRFDIDSYEFFEKVENGDMNWIIPNRFLAFAGPFPTPFDEDGYPAFTPEDYASVFDDARIGLVVRLNNKQYDRKRFIDVGIKHVDLFFRDGSCPPQDIIAKFLHITESEPGAVAVHCKAGLGRTGTLIALYAMKHFQFPARAFIAWNRLCRPGSILGPQQQFLVDMQDAMFQAGAANRCAPSRPLGGNAGQVPPQQPGAEQLLAQQMERMNLRQGEQYEDVGQGERLSNARRNRNPGSPTSSSPPVQSDAGIPFRTASYGFQSGQPLPAAR